MLYAAYFSWHKVNLLPSDVLRFVPNIKLYRIFHLVNSLKVTPVSRVVNVSLMAFWLMGNDRLSQHSSFLLILFGLLPCFLLLFPVKYVLWVLKIKLIIDDRNGLRIVLLQKIFNVRYCCIFFLLF